MRHSDKEEILADLASNPGTSPSFIKYLSSIMDNCPVVIGREVPQMDPDTFNFAMLDTLIRTNSNTSVAILFEHNGYQVFALTVLIDKKLSILLVKKLLHSDILAQRKWELPPAFIKLPCTLDYRTTREVEVISNTRGHVFSEQERTEFNTIGKYVLSCFLSNLIEKHKREEKNESERRKRDTGHPTHIVSNEMSDKLDPAERELVSMMYMLETCLIGAGGRSGVHYTYLDLLSLSKEFLSCSGTLQEFKDRLTKKVKLLNEYDNEKSK